MLQKQDDCGYRKTRLLEDGHNHQRTITHRISRENQEDKLPDDCEPDEAVVILRMRDRRRVIMPGSLLKKILRHEHDQTVDTRNQKNNLCKSHLKSPLWTIDVNATTI